MTKPGRFEGRPVITFLPDGRRVKTVEPFAFIDAASNRWDVPAGATVDGASIPRALWTFVGGPFEGKYRDASIIHDWYCDLRSRPWRSVHLVFYEAMIASSVPTPQAKLLYAGVLLGGPRWSETVMENVQHNEQIREKAKQSPEEPIPPDALGRVILKAISVTRPITESTVNINEDQIRQLQDLIVRDDPNVEAIANIVDAARKDLTQRHHDLESISIVRPTGHSTQ